MNRRTLFLICMTILFALTGCSATPQIVDPRGLTFAPLNFSIPKSDHLTLKNGMRIYLLEDHELPLVNMTALVATGGIYEPADMAGLAGMAGSLIRSGGTEFLKPDQLDAELEFMASGIESGISEDLGTLSMNTLTKNLDRTLQLYAEVMMKPGFDKSRFDLTVNNTIESIRRQNDDPKGIASREYSRALYENHPLGRIPTIDSVKKITREEIARFHKRFYRPRSIILAVSGDFNRKELLAKLETLFGNWQPEDLKLPEVNAPDTTPKKQILLARKQVSQSVIRMGHLGIEKNNPDQYAVRVMDYILGGGFTSRLTQEVRSNQGLAYHAGSRFEIGRRFPGVFTAETETKSGSTAKAITLMKDIIAGMTKEQVTEEELNQAKESIINSFIFGFTQASSIVTQQARLEYYRFPDGYLENFRDNIAKVSRDDVLKAAKKYLHPEAMTIMVVGDDKKFDQPLSIFGEVKEIKLDTFK